MHNENFSVPLGYMQDNFNLRGLVFKPDLPSKRSCIERTCTADISVYATILPLVVTFILLRILTFKLDYSRPTYQNSNCQNTASLSIQKQTFTAVLMNIFCN
jgi:hypothetical protein